MRAIQKSSAAVIVMFLAAIQGIFVGESNLAGDSGLLDVGAFADNEDILEPSAETRSWTIAMYWAADNDLDSLTDPFIQIWLDSLTEREDLALSIFIDRLEGPANVSTVTEDGWLEVADLGEVNSSDPETLSSFIEFTTEEPTLAAEHYALIIQDHGLGYLGLCVEDSEPNRPWMSIDGLGDGIRSANEATGTKLDLVVLDACTLAMVEVAYELRGLAGYLVASEKAVPFDGINYRALLSGLSDAPDMTPVELACKLVDDYAEWYSAPLGTYPTLYPYMQDFACLSVLNLSKMQVVADAFGALEEAILPAQAELKGPLTEAAKTALTAMWMNCMGCDYGADIKVMFGDFADRIRESHPEIATLADQVVSAADEIIVYEWASWRFRDRVTGMCVFVSPGIGIFDVHWDSTWNRVYGDIGLDFVDVTGWDDVLEAYFLPQKCPG